MGSIKKYIYITIGCGAIFLGTIGVLIPVLPTTPFLLLASFCFAKGSEKFNRWFLGTKLYKNHLESFVTQRAMTFKRKVCILAIADFMIAFPLIMIDKLSIKCILIVVILFKWYYFTFKIKTIKTK